jgi:hypothetical protein
MKSIIFHETFESQSSPLIMWLIMWLIMIIKHSQIRRFQHDFRYGPLRDTNFTHPGKIEVFFGKTICYGND